MQSDAACSKSVMLRLRPHVYDKVVALAEQAGAPVAAVCRQIIEAALSEGVNVAETDVPAPAPRKRRAARQAAA